MRLHYIDGLKAIGAFLVFFCHFNGVLHLFDLPKPLLFLTNGEFAVSLFLMMSGFSIAMSLKRDDSKEKVQKLILGRYFRFALPMAVVTTVAYVLYLCHGYFVNDVANVLGQSYGSTEFKNIGFHHYIAMLIWAPMSFNSLNTPLWMMKYIFEGTFVIIILHAGIGKLRLKVKAVVLFFAMLLSVMESLYITDVICGMLLFEIWNEYDRDFTKLPCSKILSIILLAFVFYVAISYRRDRVAGVSIITQTFHLLGSASLVMSVLMFGFFQKVLSTKMFRFAGGISFELYLIHWIIICSFASFIWLLLNQLNVPYWNWIVFITTTALIIGASYLLKKYAEPYICKPIENNILKSLLK